MPAEMSFPLPSTNLSFVEKLSSMLYTYPSVSADGSGKSANLIVPHGLYTGPMLMFLILSMRSLYTTFKPATFTALLLISAKIIQLLLIYEISPATLLYLRYARALFILFRRFFSRFFNDISSSHCGQYFFRSSKIYLC